MKTVIGVDPGPQQSAYVRFDGSRVLDCGIHTNHAIRAMLRDERDPDVSLAVEMVACYGLAVGKSVFDTCLWIGRYVELWNQFHQPADLVYRPDIKLHLCNSRRAKDPNIRRVLLDRFGEVGTKKHPGPLFGVKSHIWSALAVGVYWWDTRLQTQRTKL